MADAERVKFLIENNTKEELAFIIAELEEIQEYKEIKQALDECKNDDRTYSYEEIKKMLEDDKEE